MGKCYSLKGILGNEDYEFLLLRFVIFERWASNKSANFFRIGQKILFSNNVMFSVFMVVPLKFTPKLLSPRLE